MGERHAPAIEMLTVLLGKETQKQWLFSVVRVGWRLARGGGNSGEELSHLGAEGSTGGWGWLSRTIQQGARQNHKGLPPSQDGCSPQMGSCMGKNLRHNNSLQTNVRYSC